MARPKGTHVFAPEDFCDSLCEWVAEGGTIRGWCRQSGNPSRSLVAKWSSSFPWFRERLGLAKVIGYDAIAEEALEIADDGTNDFVIRKLASGELKAVLDVEHVNRSRLRVETRLKLLACWNREAYGQSVTADHKGSMTLQVVTGVPIPESTQ